MNTRQVTEKLHDYQRLASERARDVGIKTDHYVRENTWTAIAVATAIGVVLGLVLAGGRGRDNEEDE